MAAEPEKQTEPLAGTTNDGPVGLAVRWLTCRRRKSAGEKDLAAYKKLVAKGSALSDEKKDSYAKMAWWSSSTTKAGSQIFMLAPRGVKNDYDFDAYINMWELLAFALSLMHAEVVEKKQRFAVVWAQYSDHRLGPWSAWRFQNLLHTAYGENLEAVHVVHPSWTVRFLRLALWPIASDEFWDYFHSHERIEFLDTFVDMRTLKVPPDVHRYEEFLEHQAEEAREAANKQMAGGTTGMLGQAMGLKGDSQNYSAEVEKIQKLLEEQKHGKHE